MGAVRADESGHVLNDAEHADVGFATEIEFLAHVEQADFLRGGDENGAVDSRGLQVAVDAQVFVAGAGWGIDDEVVQITP